MTNDHRSLIPCDSQPPPAIAPSSEITQSHNHIPLLHSSIFLPFSTLPYPKSALSSLQPPPRTSSPYLAKIYMHKNNNIEFQVVRDGGIVCMIELVSFLTHLERQRKEKRRKSERERGKGKIERSGSGSSASGEG